jgi:hypothetical protein
MSLVLMPMKINDNLQLIGFGNLGDWLTAPWIRFCTTCKLPRCLTALISCDLWVIIYQDAMDKSWDKDMLFMK